MRDQKEARRSSFDRNARLYDSIRPSYPAALVDAVLARVTADGRMLELGAGTGKATALFAGRGRTLVALEPGAHMLDELRAHLAGVAGVTCVQTTFEAWPIDGAFDLVYAAQAIHWIDPAVRYVKAAAALSPGGHLAVIRNEKGDLDPALRAAMDAAYDRRFPLDSDERADRGHDGAERARARYVDEIAASGRFGPVTIEEVRWPRRYTADEYCQLLDTYSDHAVLDPAQRAALYTDVRAAIATHGGGTIEIDYRSLAFVARKL